jgi:hypothetical protein
VLDVCKLKRINPKQDASAPKGLKLFE